MSDNATLARAVPAEHAEVEALWLPAQDRRAQRPGLTGPLLVDGSDGDVLEGALRLAHLLARRDRVGVQVLTGVEPLPSPRSRVAALATAARSDSAAYVLGALPPIGAGERVAAARLASRLAVAAATPVLAVGPGVDRLPGSVLAAVDGGRPSLAAARAALPLLGEGGSVTLLHVVPSMEHGATGVLRALAKEIGARADIAVHLVAVQGNPPAVLGEWVSEFDLVTLGASGEFHPGPGSATAVVFEEARGTVLVAAAGEQAEPEPEWWDRP